MRKSTFAAVLLFNIASLPARALDVPNQDVAYVTMTLPQEAGNFCRSVKGMKNWLDEHKRRIGVDPQGFHEWCDNVFADPKHQGSVLEERLDRWKAYDPPDPAFSDHPNLDPIIDGRSYTASLLGMHQQGRILVCEMFYKWGGTDFGDGLESALSQAPTCDNADVKEIVKSYLLSR